MVQRYSRGLGAWLGAVFLIACGGTPDVKRDNPGSGASAGTGASAGSGGTGNAAGTGNGGTGGSLIVGGMGGKGGASSGGSAGKAGDPCRNTECDEGQRCETNDAGEAECVDNSCDDLDCSDDELCQSVDGGGHVCVDKCGSDAACPEDQYCDEDSGECVDDECTPDTRTCGAGDTISVCGSNGAPQAPIQCASAGYYESECASSDTGAGSCTCEDDWDCPADMVCDAGTCNGTGKAPTCTLPATPFSEVLPQEEFRWGGTKHDYQPGNSELDDDDPLLVGGDLDDDAVGKSFAWSAQVVSVPIVINLDDDNGDGKADERDFPEILFITHHDDNVTANGIVRALHGGGVNKGQDYFALCGAPARPATPAASYADANGAYWSDRVDPPVACDDATPCATGTCRNGSCIPAALTDCATDGNTESKNDALARSAGALAAGDLDGDGFPEIVVSLENNAFQILNNRGELLFQSEANVITTNGGMGTPQAAVTPMPAIANLDFAGLPEIIFGNRVFSLLRDGTTGAYSIDKMYAGANNAAAGRQNGVVQFGPSTCVADLTADVGLEIVAGPMAYKLPASPAAGCGTAAMPCALDVVWDARANLGAAQADGFCAIADVLGTCTDAASCAASPPGPANPLDGKPEVVMIAEGHLVILAGATGAILADQNLNGGQEGGAPNVDDFDGDGFPEIATALSDFYQVIDLQAPEATNCPAWPTVLDARGAPPGGNPARDPGDSECDADADCTLPGTTCNELAHRCVCLHNGWKRDTEDDSSRATASSVFDFNGDGAAEVVYGDECYFRVYDGTSGGVYLALPSVSRTIVENPVVADVDNDGNAEIIFVQNNWVEQCNENDTDPDGTWNPGDALDSWPDGNNDVNIDSLPNGITVLGDPSDTWVAARRVWNQHSYHVTNVLESGGIPLHEPESWKPLNGRIYNTYRSQPRNYGVAPDLALTAIQISSPDAMCGELSDQIQITVVVKNQGDLRVGPGVQVAFYGTWGGDEETLRDAGGDPIVIVLDKSLEPGASTLVTITYDVGNNPAPNDEALPESVRVAIDGGNDSADGVERECNEDNNEVDQDVEAGDDLPDLAISVDSGECGGDVVVTVSNEGSDDATDVVVRIYAGDPSSGGEVLGEATIDGPIEPGGEETVTVDIGTQNRNLTLWGVADPDDTITECNDANNIAPGPTINCDSEPH